jgi:hypothetical protein
MPESVSTFLEKECELIREFKPHPVFRWDYLCYRIDYDAISRLSIFDADVTGGPVIGIYRKRQRSLSEDQNISGKQIRGSGYQR